MPKKRYSSEQIIVKLREAEVLESKGKGQAEVACIWQKPKTINLFQDRLKQLSGYSCRFVKVTRPL